MTTLMQQPTLDERHAHAMGLSIARGEAMAVEGLSEAECRQKMKQVKAWKHQLAALEGSIRSMADQLDSAAESHRRLTTPLQEKLADDELDIEDRLTYRQQVDQANLELEKVVKPVQSRLKAAEEERQLLQVRINGAISLERRWIELADAEYKHRTRVLQRLLDSMEPYWLYKLEREHAKAAAELRRIQSENKNEYSRKRYAESSYEAEARFRSDVYHEALAFQRKLMNERDELRQKRLNDLYR